MKLVLGTHVREHGRNVGRLAGFELEPRERRIRRIIVSPDGQLGPQAHTRTLNSIGTVDASGTIQLRANFTPVALPAVPDVALLSPSTRIVAAGRTGRLHAIEVDAESRALLSVSGREHWWSRAFTIAGDALDVSQPGEIRGAAGRDPRAA